VTGTSHHEQETFLYENPLHAVLLTTKNTQQKAALRSYTSQAQFLFWLLKPAPEHAHARLLSRLSWSWIVLLPSDTHREPIMSMTAIYFTSICGLFTDSPF
jgi:hypothetical protein